MCVCLPLSCDTLVSFNISIDALAFVTVHNGNGKMWLKPVFIHMHRSIDKLTLFALLLLLLLLRSILECPDFSRLHQTLKYKLSRHTLPIELYNFLRQKDSPFYADSRWNFNQNNLMDFAFFCYIYSCATGTESRTLNPHLVSIIFIIIFVFRERKKKCYLITSHNDYWAICLVCWSVFAILNFVDKLRKNQIW